MGKINYRCELLSPFKIGKSLDFSRDIGSFCSFSFPLNNRYILYSVLTKAFGKK